MERIYKVAIDPLLVASPDASEIKMKLGGPAKPECSAAERWAEYDQSVCPSFSFPEHVHLISSILHSVMGQRIAQCPNRAPSAGYLPLARPGPRALYIL